MGGEATYTASGSRRLRADAPMAAYVVVAQEALDGLRGLIGQLSGLLILTQARLCRDVPDHPEVALARLRWQEALDQLGQMRPPRDRVEDSTRLRAAAAHIDGALAAISELGHAHVDDLVHRAAQHLSEAYRLLQVVCDHRVGLHMVDMRHACCSCGKMLEGRVRA